jgi:hypothetical protein
VDGKRAAVQVGDRERIFREEVQHRPATDVDRHAARQADELAMRRRPPLHDRKGAELGVPGDDVQAAGGVDRDLDALVIGATRLDRAQPRDIRDERDGTARGIRLAMGGGVLRLELDGHGRRRRRMDRAHRSFDRGRRRRGGRRRR